MKVTFKEKLNEAYRKYWNAQDRASNALDRITLLIQKRYPNLEASVASDEIIFINKENCLEEYYSLEDIEQRYKEYHNDRKAD